MKTKLADEIRAFVEARYLEPLRSERGARFTVRAGDVHRQMRLERRMPAVCSALSSKRFLRDNRLRLAERKGPRQGANVFFTYELMIQPLPSLGPSEHPRDGTWSPEREWFWEGNIQKRIADHLSSSGYSILSVADTASREQGPDILAEKTGRKLLVTVKGYPSERYAADSLGGRRGDQKRTALPHRRDTGFSRPSLMQSWPRTRRPTWT